LGVVRNNKTSVVVWFAPAPSLFARDSLAPVTCERRALRLGVEEDHFVRDDLLYIQLPLVHWRLTIELSGRTEAADGRA
jgi:hypothetical protein